MYKCRWFKIQELVPPHVYEERGEKAWELLDERALISLDALRDMFGPLTCNDWHIGGGRKWSGLRTAESPYYSPYSQHTMGRAFDVISGIHSAESMREKVLRHRKEKFSYITGLELNVTWLHFDVRNHAPVKVF